MNMDSGRIVLWKDLTDEERESGRWVKLGDDELAIAESIPENDRRKALAEIFKDVQKVDLEAAMKAKSFREASQ